MQSNSSRAVRKGSWWAIQAGAVIVFLSASAVAQSGTAGGMVSAGSEAENYLRFLQTAGVLPPAQWTIRPLRTAEVATLRASDKNHPWKGLTSREDSLASRKLWYVGPQITLVENSAFPYGPNNGPAWNGRGLTGTAEGGFWARYGRVTLVVAPIISFAQNSSFKLTANGVSGDLRYGDPFFEPTVDHPQRFGDASLTVIDPGESTLSIDLGYVALGASTAAQWWGPASEFPYLLGNNAGGIPRIFLSTARPLNAGFARIHGEIHWGQLTQSDYSPVTGSETFVDLAQPGQKRFATGLIVSVQPNGAPGLEIGVGRFFHRPMPKGGPSGDSWLATFAALFKKNLPAETPLPGSSNVRGVTDNQLISLFARWNLPHSGFEVYGEYGRDDHSFDQRDFTQEPDHGGASRMVGFRKALGTEWLLRGETMNFEATTTARTRGEGAVYTHSVLRQGHTMRGQLLAADLGVGSGSGSILAVDRYTSVGRSTAFYRRATQYEWPAYSTSGSEVPRDTDVMHTIGAENVRFQGSLEIATTLALVFNLNRGLREDVTNIHARVTIRKHL
jgi:hypothetical protein